MANFMSVSACRGVRPKQVNLKNTIQRENLINKLMSQRSVLRYINAPNGYGKSVLAAQYADLIFSFRDVFWINCQSPCFIRDLDSKTIASQVVQISSHQNLVVFDDLCVLDEDRIELFSNLIDELLEYNIEVLVTSTIYNDSLIKYQKDALIINNQDLLLTASELDTLENIDYSQNENIYRIPCVAWENKGINKLLKLAVAEEFIDSLKFCLFYIYMMKDASLDSLKKFVSKSDLNLLLDINKSFTYFGINEETNSFSVPEVSIKDLLNIFNSYKQSIMSKFNSENKQQFVINLIEVLESCGQINRAMEICEFLGDDKLKIKFLEKWNSISIRKSYLVNAHSLFTSTYKKIFAADINTAFQALRLAILGFVSDAIRISYGILDNKISTIDNKLFAALIFMRYGQLEEKNQAIKIIRFLKSDFKIETYLKNKNLSDFEKIKCKTISKVIDIYLAVFSENINPFNVWLNFSSENLDYEDIIAAECLLDNIPIVRTEHLRSTECQKFLNAISRNLNYALDSDFNFYSYSLVKSYLRFREEISDKSGVVAWEASENLLAKYNDYAALLKLEQNNYIKRHKPNLSLIREYSLKDIESFKKIGINYKSLFPKLSKADSEIPKLRINIFGGLTAFIDEKEILKTSFGRQNIKLICCILTLENGQEINRNKIASIIWPDSAPDQQRLNMNTHWSVFKKYLTLPNGQCPYLVRCQSSYKLNKDYFTSDLQTLEMLCADLTMGTLDSRAWLEKFKENENLLNGDLLPSETNNVYIKNKRKEYITMLVNALVAASERLMEAGEIQQALWFSTRAILRDNSREDVYSTLMKAQMLAGQRTPAIETYFACKKFLESKMNMKPSLLINNLYKKVLTEAR